MFQRGKVVGAGRVKGKVEGFLARGETGGAEGRRGEERGGGGGARAFVGDVCDRGEAGFGRKDLHGDNEIDWRGAANEDEGKKRGK